jgi:hypothetical protein
VSWQVEYALANIESISNLKAERVEGNLIRIMTLDHQDVLAVISDDYVIKLSTAESCLGQYQGVDFLCGYRAVCVWHGDAIKYLEDSRVGWGNFGTLTTAARDGNVNTASHRTYSFSDRLLKQNRSIRDLVREYDRIYLVTLKSGRSIRIGMIADYEPSADAVRSLFEFFGPVDLVWNINPNGNPSAEAVSAAADLGCEVLKWNEVRERLREG